MHISRILLNFICCWYVFLMFLPLPITKTTKIFIMQLCVFIFRSAWFSKSHERWFICWLWKNGWFFQCIDTWLAQQAKCPVCKVRLWCRNAIQTMDINRKFSKSHYLTLYIPSILLNFCCWCIFYVFATAYLWRQPKFWLWNYDTSIVFIFSLQNIRFTTHVKLETWRFLQWVSIKPIVWDFKAMVVRFNSTRFNTGQVRLGSFHKATVGIYNQLFCQNNLIWKHAHEFHLNLIMVMITDIL